MSACRNRYAENPRAPLGRSGCCPWILLGGEHDLVADVRPAGEPDPMISSERPNPAVPPYTLAVSMKLIPSSKARSRIACEVASSAFGPKCIVPRHTLLTIRLDRPSRLYSTISSRRLFPPASRGQLSPSSLGLRVSGPRLGRRGRTQPSGDVEPTPKEGARAVVAQTACRTLRPEHPTHPVREMVIALGR